jgi:hypothetical protein
LVASIGTCYTQYLWTAFRKRVHKVGLIEDLFQIQSNAFRLANHHLFTQTPILAAVAVFCWMVPIATIYPPGALTVELEAKTFDTLFNVSVFHKKDFKDNTPSLAIFGPNCTWTGNSSENIEYLRENCYLKG